MLYKPVILLTLLWPTWIVAQKHVPTDSLFRVASAVVHVIKTFDRSKSGKTVQTFTVPYDADYRKKTRLTVTFSNGTIRKFTYMAYSDGLVDAAEETYYFDSTGQLTCHPNLPKGATIYYLDRSGNRDSLSKAGPWVWYKVQTSAGRIGWVWGYPSGVHEHTDE